MLSISLVINTQIPAKKTLASKAESTPAAPEIKPEPVRISEPKPVKILLFPPINAGKWGY